MYVQRALFKPRQPSGGGGGGFPVELIRALELVPKMVPVLEFRFGVPVPRAAVESPRVRLSDQATHRAIFLG